MTDDTAHRISDLKFALDKSIRYHQRRRAFFEMAHRAVMFLVIMTGSGAAFEIFGDGRLLATIAALLGAFDLAYSPGSRARDHIILHQRFSSLLAETMRISVPSDQEIRNWTAERLRIEADEPPIFWALEKDCHNEVCFARGKSSPEYLNRLTLAERIFMQLYRFDIATPAAQRRN
jgi:hypothetical protein